MLHVLLLSVFCLVCFVPFSFLFFLFFSFFFLFISLEYYYYVFRFVGITFHLALLSVGFLSQHLVLLYYV